MHRFTLCLLVACGVGSATAQCQSYTFTTLAGKAGTHGTTDDTGSNARFWAPIGLTVDPAGNVYVADSGNYTIRKITPQGMVSTLAGLAGTSGTADGTSTNARFRMPQGVAVDSVGNVFVADSSSHTIRKITPEGVVITFAGRAGFAGSTDGTGINVRFWSPAALALDTAGNVYVANSGSHNVRKITPEGVVSSLAGLAGNPGTADGTGPNARFNTPQGVAVDSAGNVYVTDSGSHTIRKITPEGVVSTLAGRAGNPGTADGTGPNARFYVPQGIAVDSVGTLYVADMFSYTIRKVTPDGVVSTLAGRAGSSGSADGPSNTARFMLPQAVTVDSVGNLYVADTGNNTIRFGSLSFVAPPSLRFHLAANQLTLSWPQTASNYVIETSSTLASGATWTPLGNLVGTSGDSFVVTNTVDSGARFYRLRTP